MDTKQIINYIGDSYLLDPLSKNEEPIIIIDVKSSVCSLKYEVYSDKSYYLQGSHYKKFEFGNVSNNNNRLIFYIKKDQTDATYFIRFYDIKVIKLAPHNRFEIDSATKDLTDVNDPVFIFYKLKYQKSKDITNRQQLVNVELTIDDDNDDEHQIIEQSSITKTQTE